MNNSLFYNINYYENLLLSYLRTLLKLCHRWFIATFIQTIGARRLFPCWDDPQLKTAFTISIKNNRNLMALSNMPIRNYDSSQNNFTCIHFHTTPLMSTYQVAMVVSNLFPFKINANITVWCRKYLERFLRFKGGIIESITSYLEFKLNRTEIPKIDHVVIPNFPHDDVLKLGLIIHRESDFVHNEKLHPVMGNVEITRLIAFKIAHQWFSNAISPSQWYYFWLHDGLAALYGEEAIVKSFNNSRLMDLFVVQNQYESLNLGSHFNLNPPRNNNLSDVNSILSFPRYIKGLIILRMLQDTVTDNLFQRSIQTFLYKYMSTSVTPYKFWSIQEHLITNYEYFINISNVYQAWIKNEHYPVITWKENSYTVSGALSQIDTFNIVKRKWWICTNLLILPSLTTIAKIWLTPQESSFELEYTEDDMIIIDIQQAGYYRVKYDTQNWLKIVHYLNSEKYKDLSVINRAKIIDDAFYFLVTRQLNISIFWELTRYLSQEIDYVAWYPMIKVFEYISNIFPFSQDHTFIDNVKEKLRKLLDLPLKTLGFQENLMEDDLVKCLRQEIVKWACMLNHSECITTATYKLQQFYKSPSKYE
ncbi:Aminopeptidase N [Cyphomyrmex costatus]|uniref:Aminopeptidase N n=1 Tax=Cyphomyrmex costatus TaxID=456900 RepID=A0A195C0D5_9HYME|nr:Aminopeptidase N [Cyphomyrmex costatus]